MGWKALGEQTERINEMVLLTSFGVVLLGFIYFCLIQKSLTTFHRQALFGIRADLFELAVHNETFTFDSVLYKEFETSLNVAIRFAHFFTIWSILRVEALKFLFGYKAMLSRGLSETFYEEIQNIEDKLLVEKLKKLRRQYYTQMQIRLVSTAPFSFFFLLLCSAVVIPLAAIFQLLGLIEKAKKVSDVVSVTDSEIKSFSLSSLGHLRHASSVL